MLSRSSYFNCNLINPAGGTFQYKTRCLATVFHSSLVEQNRLVQFHKQSVSCEGKPSSKLVFTKSNWKWVIIPAADIKCPRMALKCIIPKKPWGSGLNVVRYITLHMQEAANYTVHVICFAGGFANKATFLYFSAKMRSERTILSQQEEKV